jgi:antitoxin Phd
MWQIQEAKQRFSELVRRAVNEGPQVVTRHGEEVVVVLSVDAYHQLGGRWRILRAFCAQHLI